MKQISNNWTISYPENFISNIADRPYIQHNQQSQVITANSPDLFTTFTYEKVDEGCYLFVVDMEAIEDTTIGLFGDREIEYYCLSYQLIKGPVEKRPVKEPEGRQAKVMSMPRICSFYNNEFDYETEFGAQSGVKAFIFCFTADWLAANINLMKADQQAQFMKVITKEINSVAYFNDDFYRDTFDELNAIMSSSTRSVVYNLVVKKLSLTLIADFFTIVTQPQSVLNTPPVSEEFEGVNRIKSYIEKNFKKGFPGLPLLAEIGLMTIPTMRRQFLRQMGRSAFDYFREVQMRHAFEMLQQGLRTKDVALMLGFKNSGNFSRLFKATYRILPTDVKTLHPAL